MHRIVLTLLCLLASTANLASQSQASPNLAAPNLAAPNLAAQTPPSAAAGVVTLSFNEAVLQTAEAQRGLTGLQSKFAPRQAHLKSLNDEVESLRAQLQTTAEKLSDAARVSREQSLNAKEKQLQREAEDFKNDSESESQQLFQTVAQKVYAFLQQYAPQRGYSVVVERGSDAAPVVWYAGNNLDITQELIKAYDKAYEAGGSRDSTPNPALKGKPAVPDSPKPH
jgi:outer membrane protein